MAGSPSERGLRVATEETWTTRRQPSARAERMIALVPSTFTARIASGSGTQMR